MTVSAEITQAPALSFTDEGVEDKRMELKWGVRDGGLYWSSKWFQVGDLLTGAGGNTHLCVLPQERERQLAAAGFRPAVWKWGDSLRRRTARRAEGSYKPAKKKKRNVADPVTQSGMLGAAGIFSGRKTMGGTQVGG